MSVPFQHTNERILYRTRRSITALFVSLLRGLFQGVIGGGILALLVAAMFFLALGEISMFVPFVTLLVIVFLLLFRYVVLWRTTTLTITTQRILVHGYDLLLEQGKERKRHRSLFHALTHTLRWETYQESVFEGGVLAHLGNTGTLTIRHGTAEASRSVVMDMLPYAQDLKHYLDKIQSLKASHVPDSELPAFVRARKGKRDRAVLTEV